VAETTTSGLTIDAPDPKEVPAADEKPVNPFEPLLHEAIIKLRRGHHAAAVACLVDAINGIAVSQGLNAKARLA
jgi:hypothetical protein